MVPVSGIVTAEREALVRLVVLGSEDPGTSAEIEAVLDTGFTGHLTLPPEVIEELGLPLLGSRNSVLAETAAASPWTYTVRGSYGTVGVGRWRFSPLEAEHWPACL